MKRESLEDLDQFLERLRLKLRLIMKEKLTEQGTNVSVELKLDFLCVKLTLKRSIISSLELKLWCQKSITTFMDY